MFLMGAEITCIKKDDRLNPYERITHVGGVISGGEKFFMSSTVVF